MNIKDIYKGNRSTENANKNSVLIPTGRDLLAGYSARDYALTQILESSVRDAHIAGDIHYHDLDYAPFFPMFNCMLIDLQGMLENGFRMGNAHISTPRSITTACAVTAQIIAQVGSHIYGGMTLDRLDEVLAPYVEKTFHKACERAMILIQRTIKSSSNTSRWKMAAWAWDETKRECYQAFQGLEYEINTLHTANGQTPFITLGFGLGQCRWSRLIQECLLKVRMQGLGITQETAIFPKLVFTIKKGVNFYAKDPNYYLKQLALKCAATRMYPDILNYDKVVEVTGSFKAPMGCRSFLSKLHENEINPAGRCNLGVVTLNLPRLAIESRYAVNFFMDKLADTLKVAHEALRSRFDRFAGVTTEVAPILYTEGACGIRLQEGARIQQLFEKGRASLSLGYIGLHEVMQLLSRDKENPAYSQDKVHLAKAILMYLRDEVARWKKIEGLGYSLYSTPSESLCERFCRLDREKYGLIAGITDKGYYTNSFHLDVAEKVDPYQKIDFETGYAEMASGGHISYVELPDTIRHNLRGLEAIWDYSYDRIPYLGINVPADVCHKCFYKGEMTARTAGFVCPQCGEKEAISVVRRVCGYLGNPHKRPFNAGKQEEVKRRKKHL